MDGIKKMIRFDFQTVEPITFRIMLLSLGVFVFISIFFFPFSAVALPIFGVVLFGPLESIVVKDGIRRLYGILPIRKSSVIWARFVEVVAALLVLELLAIIIGVVSYKIKLFTINPFSKDIAEQAIHMINTGEAIPNLISASQRVFTIVCMSACFFTMTSLIFGQEYDLLITVIMIIVIGGLIALTVVCDGNGWIDFTITKEFFIADGKWQLILYNILYHLITVVLCALFGLTTVNIFNKREL